MNEIDYVFSFENVTMSWEGSRMIYTELHVSIINTKVAMAESRVSGLLVIQFLYTAHVECGIFE